TVLQNAIIHIGQCTFQFSPSDLTDFTCNAVPLWEKTLLIQRIRIFRNTGIGIRIANGLLNQGFLFAGHFPEKTIKELEKLTGFWSQRYDNDYFFSSYFIGNFNLFFGDGEWVNTYFSTFSYFDFTPTKQA